MDGALSSGLLFQAFFEISEIDPHGKKFDRVSRIIASSENVISELTLDINTEIYPLETGDNFTLTLANSIEQGVITDVTKKASWKPTSKSLADEYEYVMYGKVYKYDDSNQSKVTVYCSFGGLLMCLGGDYRALQNIKNNHQFIKEFQEQNIFLIDKVQFQFPDKIVDFVVENNILVLVCGKALLLWIDLDKPNSIVEIPILLSTPNTAVEKIYLSPLAQGLVISATNGDNFFYYPPSSSSTPSSSVKPKPLSKIKGRISAVGWPTSSLKGSILVGTRGGAIFDLEVSPTDTKKFEKSCLQAFAEKEQISGLRYTYMSCGLVVFVATLSKIYQFIGPRETLSIGSLLADHSNADVQEISGSLPTSSLSLYSPTLQTPTFLAWSTSPGLYVGSIETTSKTAKHSGDSVLQNILIVPYPSVNGTEITPISFAVSEYHFIILTLDSLVMVNRLESMIQYIVPLTLEMDERPVSLVKDDQRGTFWIATTQSLYEIIVSEEDRNIWKIYYDRKQFKEALAIAKTSEAKRLIAEKYADDCMRRKDYNTAAELYSRTKQSLEQVSLLFLRLKLDTTKPLQIFLQRRLALLRDVEDWTQTVMISSWVLELMLSDLDYYIDQSLTGKEKSGAFKKDLDGVVDSIQMLLKTYKNRLHAPTIYSLLKQHGKQDLELFFAETINDASRICEIHLSNKEWSKALQIMGTQTNPKLVYKHSPLLIQHIPGEVVTLWTRCGSSFLNPRLLLPSMLQYEIQKKEIRDPRFDLVVSPGTGKNQIIKYLEHIINNEQNTDRVIHNYLFYLYVSMLPEIDKETTVINFIQSQANEGLFRGIDSVYFDVQYALKLCQQYNLLQACVQLYLVLDMQQDALSLALKSNDLEMANGIVDSVDDEDEDIRKQLWLQIAKHVIANNQDYKGAMKMCKDGVLKIENILPLFPDFVEIDLVKQDLIDALQMYNAELAALSKELDESANSSDMIRRDINSLKNRSVVIPVSRKCDGCSRSLMTRQFHVYPCQHAFHTTCVVSELLQYPIKAPRVKHFQSQISANPKAKDDLDRLISEECIFCSDVMIRTIDMDLVEETDIL